MQKFKAHQLNIFSVLQEVYSINNADLDTLKGRELAANAPVIDIFRTNQLVAKVKVEMRDYELVQVGKPS